MNTPRPGKIILLLSAIAGTTVAFAADLPTPEEYAANWPRFRGPDGSGVFAKGEVPLPCDVKTGANIAWIVEVPAPGFSSPVVWGERVFLSGGDAAKRTVMCFDANSGKLRWQREVPKTAKSPENFEVPDQCGMAASTVATDGRRVFAIFADGDLAALTFDGEVAWSKSLGIPKNQYGHATSLLTWQDRVIVQFDQGEADDKLSKIFAFDSATGAAVWEKPRPVGESWATPIAFDSAGGPQLLTLGNPWAISYSPKDGAELWRADCLDGEVTPSPVFAGGALFIISPTHALMSVRPDGHGDVTKTHVGWKAEDGIPDVTGPVTNGELIFVVDSAGMLTCYDAKNGSKQWEHELGEEVAASPAIVGKRVCLFTKKGTLVAVDVGREFNESGRSRMGEPVFASPAFTPGKIFVRGAKHLICIGAKP